MKKLFAVVLAVAVLASSFIISAYAINIYEDKDYYWEPGDGCEVVATVSSWNGSGEYGTYPTRKGVILVTEDASLKIRDNNVGLVGHAAIVYSSEKVVHAFHLSEYGNDLPGLGQVTMGKNDWRTSKVGGFVGLAVDETTAAQDRDIANWCEDQIGAPYVLAPLMWNVRSAFYCSQLIYAGFKDIADVDLNSDTGSLIPGFIAPYELVNSPRTYLVYAKNWSQN